MMEQRPYAPQGNYTRFYMNSTSDVSGSQNHIFSHPSSVSNSPRAFPDPQYYKPSHSRSSSLSNDYFSDCDSNPQYCTPISEDADADAYPAPYVQRRLSQLQPLSTSTTSTTAAERSCFPPDAVSACYPEEFAPGRFRNRAFSQTVRLGDLLPPSPTHSTLPRRRVQSAVDALAFAYPGSLHRMGSAYEPGVPAGSGMNSNALGSGMNSNALGSGMNSNALGSGMNSNALGSGMNSNALSGGLSSSMSGGRYAGQTARGDALYHAGSLSSHGRVYDLVQSSEHLSSASDFSLVEKDSVLSPELLAMLESPFYSALWYGPEGGEAAAWERAKEDADAQLEECIRQCIQLKKNCLVNRCRVQFLQLLTRFGSFVQVWVEFARMEMESGYYAQAEFILTTALLFHRHNLTILGKLIKVEEKLQSRAGLDRVFQTLKEVPTQKALQLVVATAQSLAVIGGDCSEIDAMLEAVLTGDEAQPGWLYNDIVQYFFSVCDFAALFSLLSLILRRLPKHGPLWCVALLIADHYAVTEWNRDALLPCSASALYDSFTLSAHRALTSDVLWKLYVVRLQRATRLVTVLREMVKRPWLSSVPQDRMLEGVHRLLVQAVADTEACLRYCPANQRWRVFASLGRVQAILGFRGMARACLRRSLALCPKKNQHSVYFQFAKVEFFNFHPAQAFYLLYKSTPIFVNEWKLQLQAAICLIYENRFNEALTLCSDVLQIQIGAGRFWAVLIHFVHEYEIGGFFDT